MTISTFALNDFNIDKLRALRAYVTPEILELINQSETLKSILNGYIGSASVDKVIVSTDSPDSASYTLPADGRNGFATFGVNRLTNAFDFIAIVSHELGHFLVEGAGAVIQAAREAALDSGDFAGYEAACNLTEGYAHLTTAQVFDEILSSDLGAGSSFTLTRMRASGDYREYTDLRSQAIALSWDWSEVESPQTYNAIAYAMGESNKGRFTSTTNETYLEFCRNEAATVLRRGASAPAPGNGETVFIDAISDTGFRGTIVYTNASGQGTQRIVYTTDSGVITRTETNPITGQTISQTTIQVFDDGSILELTTDANGRQTVSAAEANTGSLTPVTSVAGLLDAEHQTRLGVDSGTVSGSFWDSLTNFVSNTLLGDTSFGSAPIPSNPYNVPTPSWGNPIGAFYDSQSTSYDTAASIARYTPVLVDANQRAVTAAQLTALDTNKDGQLSLAESAGLRFWRDLDEQGQAGAGEVTAVDRVISAAEYGLCTRAVQIRDVDEISNGTAANGMKWRKVA